MVIHKLTRWAGVGAAVLCCGIASANIDLEWRPAAQVVRVGDTVQIGLYAVSDDGMSNQPISAMDVLLQWDAGTLALLGVDDIGPYPWFQSGFPDDSALDGLNDTWEDGDAKYTALANFLDPAMATPEGLLVTAFEFTAIQAAPMNELVIPSELGLFSHTTVFGIDYPGQDVTGTLGSAQVVICPGPADGDMNVDGSTDGADIAGFIEALIEGSAEAEDLCPGDFNGNGIIDLEDVSPMVAALLTP